jgi:OOP family OmpA-OmpF porin
VGTLQKEVVSFVLLNKKGVYMTRRQWMWLWIWLLIFFIIFCVWSKLQLLTNDIKAPVQSISPIAATTTETVGNITKAEVEKEDINFKIIKKDQGIKISGLFASKEDLDTLKNEYLKIFDTVDEGIIVINKEVENNKIMELLPKLSEDFAKFKSGYLEYAHGKLTIDGIVDDTHVKQNISDKVLNVGNVEVDNKVLLEKIEPTVEEVTQTPSNEDIQSKLDNLLKVKNVEFVFAQDKLTQNGKKTINEVYEILRKYENVKIEIGGHTDSTGTQKNNKYLSQNRAEAIKRYLISKGIKSERLQAVGYGERKPLVKNSSSKNRQINRRVEFKILGE